MKLKPVATQSPLAYPSRRPPKKLLPRWLRRVGSAAAISIALAQTGCYGVTAVPESDGGPLDADAVDARGRDSDMVSDASDDGDAILSTDAHVDGDAPSDADADVPTRLLGLCEPDHRLAGDGMPTDFTQFACGSAMPTDAPTHATPSYVLSGTLCGEQQAAWAMVEVNEPHEYAVAFPWGGTNARVLVRAPDGSVVFEATPEQPCGWLAFDAGTWVLEAHPAGPDVEVGDSFHVTVDELY